MGIGSQWFLKKRFKKLRKFPSRLQGNASVNFLFDPTFQYFIDIKNDGGLVVQMQPDADKPGE